MREHETVDRRLVIPFLRNSKILRLKKEDHDIKGIESLLEKRGSNFEKDVLYEIRRRGLPLPDDGSKMIYDKNSKPVVQSDFNYVERIFYYSLMESLIIEII